MPRSTRNAIVTGGSSGMGFAIASDFLRCGIGVAILARDSERANAAAEILRRQGGKVCAVQADVAQAAQVKEAVSQAATAIGEAHILVNSAGCTTFAPILELTEETFDRELAVNLKGTFNCIRAVLPGMLRVGWGRIITVAGLAGQMGAVELSAYAAAKAGVIGLTKAVAREVGAKGITCNCISPGPIDTPMLRAASTAAA